MAEETGQEKSEQATQKRREETRKRGQVARSTEITSAGMLLAGFTVLLFFSGYLLTSLRDVFSGTFMMSSTYNLSLLNTRYLFTNMILKLAAILLPVFVIMVVTGIAINIVQVGFLVTGEPLQPKLNKINPIEGFKRIFSRRSVEMLVRDILKIVVVVWIGYTSLRNIMPQIMEIGSYSVNQIFSFAGHPVYT